jgi:cytidylate kinase
VIVAIDGPAGAGKSTVARAAAAALGFTYMDSGAMYRSVALAANERGLPAAEVAGSVSIEFGPLRADGRPGVVLNGEDVSEEIRTPEISEAASVVAADPAVRAALVDLQRRLIATGDYVAEGRDIGTVVAPDADLKVFLTASPEERARRRADELGLAVEDVLADQTARDERDRTREHSPLVAADDAVELDTTGLSVDEVVGRIVELVRERRGSA